MKKFLTTCAVLGISFAVIGCGKKDDDKKSDPTFQYVASSDSIQVPITVSDTQGTFEITEDSVNALQPQSGASDSVKVALTNGCKYQLLKGVYKFTSEFNLGYKAINGVPDLDVVPGDRVVHLDFVKGAGSSAIVSDGYFEQFKLNVFFKDSFLQVSCDYSAR
ncbi:MAG: hypothetical protein EOP07_01475 [Proteobacteria bacterium]|nr:MAG: hypothetical protein EOP07_01475 [Pseudomonadota bacterium]